MRPSIAPAGPQPITQHVAYGTRVITVSFLTPMG
jgi:hypothetical protein